MLSAAQENILLDWQRSSNGYPVDLDELRSHMLTRPDGTCAQKRSLVNFVHLTWPNPEGNYEEIQQRGIHNTCRIHLTVESALAVVARYNHSLITAICVRLLHHSRQLEEANKRHARESQERFRPVEAELAEASKKNAELSTLVKYQAMRLEAQTVQLNQVNGANSDMQVRIQYLSMRINELDQAKTDLRAQVADLREKLFQAHRRRQ